MLTVTSVLRSIWWNNFISYCMYVLIVFEKKNNFTEYANVTLCQMFSVRCCCKFWRRLRCFYWISEYIQLFL